ncbi:MAG: hypothetical protein AAFP70_13955, partial [Calditrichota bacterium]
MLEILILLITAYFVFRVTRYVYKTADEPTEEPSETDTDEKLPSTPAEQLYKLAGGLEEFYHQSAFPADFLTQEDFNKGVELLKESSFSLPDMLSYYNGMNVIIACMALEALYHRKDEFDVQSTVLKNLNDGSYWKRYYAMKLLDNRISEPLIGLVVSKTDGTWEDPVPQRILREFIQARIDKGEAVTFGDHLANVEEGDLENVLKNVQILGEAFENTLLFPCKEYF